MSRGTTFASVEDMSLMSRKIVTLPYIYLSLSQTEKLKVMLTDKRVIQKSGLFIQNCFFDKNK